MLIIIADSVRGDGSRGGDNWEFVVQEDGCTGDSRGSWGVFGSSDVCRDFRMVLQCTYQSWPNVQRHL